VLDILLKWGVSHSHSHYMTYVLKLPILKFYENLIDLKMNTTNFIDFISMTHQLKPEIA